MQLIPIRHTWGLPGDAAAALDRLHATGYRGLEHGAEQMTPALRERLRAMGWRWIAQAWSDHWRYSGDPAQHRADLAEQMRKAADLGADLLNVHAGQDSWDEDTAAAFLTDIRADADRLGVAMTCETHRGRILYNPWTTARLCTRLPWLRLTADYSHFCVVAERLLADQAALFAGLAGRVDHIHARVGHPQGAQVNDPRAPEHAAALAAHEAWWDGIIAARTAAGCTWTTLTPEFGPPDYLQTLPHTRAPVTDLAAVCDWMAARLVARYSEKSVPR